MEAKGFESIIFLATQRGDFYCPNVGSGNGCPSLMRMDTYMLVCGKIVARQGMSKNEKGYDVLTNESGQTLAIQPDEELVFLEIGLFDAAAKVRIEELMQRAGIEFSDAMKAFFHSSVGSLSEQSSNAQLTV